MKNKIMKVMFLSIICLVAATILSGCDLHFHDYTDGKYAYEIAVDHGFKGTEKQWLESINGVGISDVKISYEVDDNGVIYTVFSLFVLMVLQRL